MALDEAYRIQAAEPGDLPALAGVEARAARLFPETLLPAALRGDTLPPALLADAQRQGRLWVARHRGAAVVGFACAERLGELALLREIDVDPDHGRRGVASALLAPVFDWAMGQGAEALYLTTFAAFEPGRRLYRRTGFLPLDPERAPPAIVALLRAERAAGLGERLAMVRTWAGRSAPA